jgi:truncated hemoglobin YjbI
LNCDFKRLMSIETEAFSLSAQQTSATALKLGRLLSGISILHGKTGRRLQRLKPLRSAFLVQPERRRQWLGTLDR